MFAIGHLSLGYLSSKICQKSLSVDVNLPLLFAVSLIPDVDLLIPVLLHRGPSHSIIVLTIAFAPILLFYRKRGIAYYAAIVQHVVVGDFPTGSGVQMFWPLTSNWYGLGLRMTSLTIVLAEWASFILAITVLAQTKDIHQLLKPKRSNLLLAVPSGAIFLSSIVGMSPPAPIGLLIPHLAFLLIFAFSMLRYLAAKTR